MKYFIFLASILFFLDASDIKSQIQNLEKRIQEQEQRLIFGHKETAFSLGGRIQLDTVLNRPSVNANGGTNTYDYYLTPNSFSNNADTSKVSANAKSSRLWFKTRRQTPVGLLRSLIEIDFWGSAGNENTTNSHNPRLRHAYINLNNWTIGQTYTTFMGNSLPDVIILTADVAFVRQPLLRYCIKEGQLSYDLALENPETRLTSLDTNTTTAYNDDPFFDTVMRVRFENKTTKFALSGVLRPITVQINQQSTSKWAWGVNTTLKHSFKNNDYVQASLATGKGLGRYLSLAFFSSGELTTSNSTIELLPVSSGHISYTHHINKKLRTTFLASTIKTHSVDNLQFLQSDRTSVVHTNLRFTPFSQALISLEYAVGERVSPSISRQKLQRVMSSFSYIF